jgi:hypothetical protein
MSPSATPDSGHSVTTDQIPTLTQDMVVPLVPQAVSLALDARAAEKKALMALSEELVQNLRPEIDRLTADLVQRTLQGVWDQRARIYQDA